MSEEKLEDVREEGSKKNRMTMLVLCWFLGFLGIHRLYAGKIGSGFLMMYGTICTIVMLLADKACGLMALVAMATFVLMDFVTIAFGEFKDCYGKRVASDKIN